MAKTPVTTGGLTAGKLGMIVVLAIIFLVVIVVQFGGGGNAQPPTKRAPRTAQANTSGDQTNSREPTVNAEKSKRWPVYKVKDLLEHNPFSLPKELRPPEPADPRLAAEASQDIPVEAGMRDLHRRQADLIASLKERGVDMVLVTPHGRVARVGPDSFREGDLVEGLVVKEISSAGIVFVQEPTLGQR